MVTRKKNPLTEYEKAKAFADKVRKASGRADEVAEKYRVASEKAAELSAQKETAEKAEQDALTALQAHLNGLQDTNSVSVSVVDESDAEDDADEDDGAW